MKSLVIILVTVLLHGKAPSSSHKIIFYDLGGIGSSSPWDDYYPQPLASGSNFNVYEN